MNDQVILHIPPGPGPATPTATRSFCTFPRAPGQPPQRRPGHSAHCPGPRASHPCGDQVILHIPPGELQRATKSYGELQSATKRYIKLHRLQRATESYRGLQRATQSYIKLHRGTGSYKELQRATESYKEPQRATESYRKLHRAT